MAEPELEPIGAEFKLGGMKSLQTAFGGDDLALSHLSTLAHLKNDGGVGRGYDITRGLNTAEAQRWNLFDLQFEGSDGNRTDLFLVKKGPTGEPIAKAKVETVSRPAHTYLLIYGVTADDYVNDVSQKLGLEAGYKGFSGAISNSIATSTSLKSSNSILTVRAIRTIASYELPSNFKDFVRPEVADILNGSSEELTDLFESFGTHFVRRSLIGGYCDCTSVIRSASQGSERKVEQAAKAAFEAATEKAGSAALTAERASQTSETFKTDTEDTRWSSVGGTRAVQKVTDLPDWAASVARDPTMCGLSGSNALMPIWTLCASPERASQVEQLAKTYLDSRRSAIVYATEERLTLAKCERFATLLTDKGMGTANDLSVFVPQRGADQSDYYLLGHVVETHYGSARGSTYLVKDTSAAQSLLKPPASCTKVWDSAGSGFGEFSIWKMMPPEGYVALGHIVSASWNAPSLDDFRCVRVADTEEAHYAGSLWSNSIGKLNAAASLSNGWMAIARVWQAGEVGGAVRIGNREVEIYRIAPKTPARGIDLNLFHAFDYWNNPQGVPRTLKSELLNG